MACRSLPKVDAHHHLWDVESNRYDWLTAGKHFLGDLSPIAGSYLVQDFLEDTKNQNVVKSVHLQAEMDGDPVRETQWLQAVANKHGFPHGIVAFADLADPRVEDTIRRHAECPNLRGIRYLLNEHADARYCVVKQRGIMRDPQWRQGLALLPRYGLSFDLHVYACQANDALHLVRSFPQVTFVLNHTGIPIDRLPADVQRWRDMMRELAAERNVYCKISGLGMTDRTWTEASIRPFVEHAIECFGPDRAMFASNFPVDKLMSSYDALWDAYGSIVADRPRAEQMKLFHDTAVKVYRL